MLTSNSPLKKPVTAVRRAAQILRYLGKLDRPAGVNMIARDLDIVPSTCLHILRTLTHEGLTAFDPSTKQYRLGPALLSLSRDALANSDFVREAKPRMDELAARHGVTMTATELDSTEHMVVVSISQAPEILSIHVNVGSRFPALISASGRCYAAQNNWTQKELRPRFRALRWQSPLTFKAWFGEVAAARHDGYAIDRGHYIRGLTITAAPVLGNDGHVVRAIAAIGIAEQLTGKKELRVALDIKEAAEQLSA